MKTGFEKEHAALLKVIDTEIADFCTDWQYIRKSDEFETTAHLLAHLAREILKGLKSRVPKDIDEKIYNDIIRYFHDFLIAEKEGKHLEKKSNLKWYGLILRIS